MAVNTNINIPQSPFLDNLTGRPSREWMIWLQYPQVVSINLANALGPASGGTGTSAIPKNGQTLIGNGTTYTVAYLTPDVGIGITNGSGSITIKNTGVLSFSAGSTGLLPSSATTGDVTLSGVLKAVNGGTGQSAYAIGDILYANTTTTLAKLPDVATGNALISGGVATAPSWGKIKLTTHVSGTLPIANGGTNSTATPTAYGISYGTGSAYAFTAAGTDKQVLKANTGAAPTWTTLTTGTSILYGDGSGGFSNVTIGSGVSFVSGTLSATGSGGTITSVTATSPVVSSGGTTPDISLATAYGDTKNPYATKTANYVLAGPASGAAAVPTFRALVAADIPSLPYGTGTVTSVSFTGGIISVATATTTPALTVAGTSGGIPYFASGTTWASSGALTQYGVVYGGGAGAAPVATAAGTTGQVLTATTGGAPTWAAPATNGTVTSVSVVSANGFAGTVATSTTTPAITLTTSITGLLKGNGTAISAAVANTDYVPLSTVLTKTADYTITGTDTWIINNKTGSALTLTFPAASSWTGRSITVKNMQAQLVNSASANIVPIDSTTAGTAILLGVVGNWATMVSDGTNWVIMQAASNNNLLLE